MSDLAIPIPNEIIEGLARAVAKRALELIRDDLDHSSPWMTTEEAAEYTRIKLGTFKDLSAAGKLPVAMYEGRRKLYNRQDLDHWLRTGQLERNGKPGLRAA